MGETLRTYSGLALAFMGDAVYSLYVSERIVRRANMSAAKLHAKVSKIVRAPAQAEALDRIESMLSDDERDAVRRGMNSKPEHKAKNATGYEYQKATALEALFGYLFLEGRNDRIDELIDVCIGE
ncbi:MAG: ribonuclease III [Lachnospiraceae bacterium]|nr:ribonuclease III [Lachnospiraceae bacterium]